MDLLMGLGLTRFRCTEKNNGESEKEESKPLYLALSSDKPTCFLWIHAQEKDAHQWNGAWH
jgi:hypothetical protein